MTNPSPEKSPEAFRTISEVAAELDLPQHVLRFWETKFSQIRPMKRSGGRRFYRPEDVALVRTIRGLLYGQGYTIRGVQQILKEQGVRAVVAAGSDAAASGPALDADPPELGAQPAALDAARPSPGAVPPARVLRALQAELASLASALAAAREDAAPDSA